MEEIYKNILNRIFENADLLNADINLLKGIIKGEEKANYLQHKSLFKLITNKKTNIDNRINKISLSETSQNNKKESTDKMLIEIKGISVDNKPRKDGRYQARYHDDLGKRHSIYGKTQEEAKQKALRLHGKPHFKKNQTLLKNWLIEWYDRYKKSQVSSDYQKTQKNYMNTISNKLGHYDITKISSEQIQDFFNCMDDGNTKNKIFSFFNASMTKAKALNKIKNNPLENVEIKKHKPISYSPINISNQDIILNAIKDTEMKKLFFISCCIGTRISETLGIKYSDIDTKEMVININKQFTRKNKFNNKLKKEAKPRYIPFINDLLKYIDFNHEKKRKII